MPGLLEDSETADAALSEVRKTRLRLNALDALNALLDEFLFNILKNASSLSTDRLRASLLELLPTSLGKEALLDAQVELRTYYEQMGTNTVLPQDDDSKTFNLQYAFELLRLKCAAYSTLNGGDEDTKAEARVMEKMRDTGAAPFSPFRIAPASLYLTAIIEAVCEHMLGIVASVAARDSSRTDATINDLFIALCEDEGIYSSFKSMKVYEQIEQLSNASQQQMQRGKSFRRASKHSMSRLASAHHDPAATMMSSPNSSYTRVSAETLTTQVGTASGHGSQPSSAGAGKKFINNRPSHDSFSIVAHKRAQSDSSKMTSSALEDHTPYEDAEALQEFDDLMRSSSTMKVSLTPDRLKTMEAYKHEKAQRPPFGTKIQFDTAAITHKSSTREVHSIVEDEEESLLPKQPPRHRQETGTAPPSPSIISGASRIRSVSMSSPGSRAFGKKVVRNVPPVSSTRLFQDSSPSLPSPNMLSPPEPNTFPSRTRKIQRNLEMMDIDDVMNGSDEEQSDPPPRVPAKPPATATLRSSNRQGRSGLSASTRDLIDFLAEGPPDSHRNGDVLDSPNSGSFTADNGKKNPGRLQRMISKLNLGGSEKGPTKHSPPPPQTLGSKGSNGALASLANKPVPPRYPRPPSPPPSSPSSTEEPTPLQARLLNGRDQDNTLLARSPKAPQSSSTSIVTPKQDEDGSSKHQGHETDRISNSVNHRSPASAERGHPKSPAVTRSLSCRKPVPPLDPVAPLPAEIVASPVSSTSVRLPDADVREMHRLMSQAASADECRLILDMFLAKSGIQMDRAKTPRTVPFASTLDSPLENAVVELLLGGEIPTEALTSPRKLRTKRHKKGLTLRPHTTDGSSPQGSPVSSTFPIAAAS